MIKKLSNSVREYKKEAIKTSFFVTSAKYIVDFFSWHIIIILRIDKKGTLKYVN